MARSTVRVEGLRELDRALRKLPEATSKSILRKVLVEVAKPMAADMEAMAPRADGDLQAGIGYGTRLTKRQAALHRKMFKDDRAAVELFVGAGGHPQAVQQEFGNANHPAQPFVRPVWDGHKSTLVDDISKDLWTRIDKAARRLARKASRGK